MSKTQTIAVFNKTTKEILAIIPLQDGEQGICRNDIDFQIYNGTEPVFEETDHGIRLKQNAVIVNPPKE